MYTIEILYDNNLKEVFKDVRSIKYQMGASMKTVSADNLLAERILLGRDIYIFNDEMQHIINGEEAKYLAIIKS